jgi:hypothetical protein
MDALIAAYREGLALAAVAVIAGPDGVQITTPADDSELGPGEIIVARWWCRRAAEAEYVADSAARSLRRLRDKAPDASRIACESVRRAAHRLGVALQTDEDILAEAKRAIARLDTEIVRQKQSGSLKSVNQSYRQYRLEASGRGERVLPYAKWMGCYKEKLIREIAANLRRL